MSRRDDVRGDWRRVSNEQFHDLRLKKYHSGDQIKKNEMVGASGLNQEEHMYIKSLGGKT